MIPRSIIQPAGERSEIEEALQYEQQRYWRIEYALKTDFKIENVRFIHNPQWRDGFFSIQGIRDVVEGKDKRITPRVIVWRGVQVLWVSSSLVAAGGAGGVLMLIHKPVWAAMSFCVGCLLSLLVPLYRKSEIAIQEWMLARLLRKSRAERLERSIFLADHAMANVRNNMQAKRNRARVTVAGHIYRMHA